MAEDLRQHPVSAADRPSLCRTTGPVVAPPPCRVPLGAVDRSSFWSSPLRRAPVHGTVAPGLSHPRSSAAPPQRTDGRDQRACTSTAGRTSSRPTRSGRPAPPAGAACSASCWSRRSASAWSPARHRPRSPTRSPREHRRCRLPCRRARSPRRSSRCGRCRRTPSRRASPPASRRRPAGWTSATGCRPRPARPCSGATGTATAPTPRWSSPLGRGRCTTRWSVRRRLPPGRSRSGSQAIDPSSATGTVTGPRTSGWCARQHLVSP